MATRVEWKCDKYSKSAGLPWMLDALLSVHQSDSETCPYCGNKTHLHLSFDFATSTSGRTKCRVLDVFLPPKDLRKPWSKGGQRIEYYPFLVVVKLDKGGGLAVWLPYWHVKKGPQKILKRYGQWAPFMETELYESLLAQAQVKGYFKGVTF